MSNNFLKITPCGEDCGQCGFFHDGGCKGCRENGGKCVRMWESAVGYINAVRNTARISAAYAGNSLVNI